MMSQKFIYPGRELEAMAAAVNYHRWILEIFKPYLGVNIVEVGAGAGSFSELLLSEHACETLTLIEPSEDLFRELEVCVQQLETAARVAIHNSTFRESIPLIGAPQPPDSIIYVNVLEHIEDDDEELIAVRETLSDGGRLLLFVPALSWLYGAIDKRIAHFRRYSKEDLEEKLRRLGFWVLRSNYFDFAGIFPWWVRYVLLKSDSLEPGSVLLYDRFVVPIIRRVETLVTPPIGKNLIMVAEKRIPGSCEIV